MKQYLKQFIYLLDAKAKKAIPFLIVIFLFSSFLDVIGIGLIGIFLGLIANTHLFINKFSNFSYFLSKLTDKELILYSGLFIIIAFAIKAILALYVQAKTVSFCQSFSIRLKSRLMSAYQNAPYAYHLNKNSANLISIIQINVGNYINNVILATLNLISNSIITIFVLSFLIIIYPIYTLLLIVLFALVGLGFDILVKHKLSLVGKIVSESTGSIIKAISQGIHGLVEIRVLGKEDYFLNSLNKFSSDYAHATGVFIAMQQIPRFLIENIIAIFIVGLCLAFIIVGVDLAHVIAIVGMFAVASTRLLPTVNQIVSTINQIRGSYRNMSIIYDDLKELDAVCARLDKSFFIKNEAKLDFLEIALHNVCYEYPNTNHFTLKNVNVSLLKGQSIGIIGPSGAGKSTLVNIVLCLLIPQQGQVIVDGNLIKNNRLWLNNFAYIPQTIFLLDDTLRRNIALGVGDDAIDDMQLWNAIKQAQLTDVVHELHDGLDTIIGENGVKLSGGQRQRVALARAFYHERNIIIMDEATSALDYETEHEVISTIKRLKGNKTLIVIAHRLSTVEHCDVLYRIEKGQVVAVGSFEEVVGARTISTWETGNIIDNQRI